MAEWPDSHAVTAASRGLYVCEVCRQISRVAAHPGKASCPRCGATLHLRKPDSLNRAWALLMAAYILFMPANLLPIMETGSLFASQKDTIMSGVVYLWRSGSWPLALLVFFASIIVPLFKLLSMTFLLVSVRNHSTLRRRARTRLYRLLEFIGRWSMLDIYVVTLLTALVHIQGFAVITPQPGAIAFGGVVVLTMLSALAFDPRLIWDEVGHEPSMLSHPPVQADD